MPTRTPANRQILIATLLVANSAVAANLHPGTIPFSFQDVADTQRHKKAFSRCSKVQNVIIRRKYHQHQH
jgi:hypothetical protein